MNGERDAQPKAGSAALAVHGMGMQAEVAMIVNDSEGWDSQERWPLTRREREVLRLVATGLRNREIADALGVSVRTVDQHLCSIFNRLGVSSRTAAVARVLGLE